MANARSRATGRALKQLRLARGLTLGQLGDLIGVKKQNVDAWEKGVTPNVSLAIRLGHALGVDPSAEFEQLFAGPRPKPSRTTKV